ncbi:MAG: DUF58 domain-containing protein [Acetobacteraceae bacterium]
MSGHHPAPHELGLEAAALASRLPPLLVAAKRIAATVAQGVHGRRRVGTGDSFWQFRPYAPGDPVARIDWRQAARSGRPAPLGWHVRETEWEAAETVCLWADASPSMDWHSSQAATTKHHRAALMLLALAALLLRGGERVVLPGIDPRPALGLGALERLATTLLVPAPDSRSPIAGSSVAGSPTQVSTTAPNGQLPPATAIPRHARVVLIGDFLGPQAEFEGALAGYAGRAAGGVLLQVLDPAEETLPYAGRIRFDGLEGEGAFLAARAEDLRAAYAGRLAAQRAGLAALCRAGNFRFASHRTDRPPETALLALYTALAETPGAGPPAMPLFAAPPPFTRPTSG